MLLQLGNELCCDQIGFQLAGGQEGKGCRSSLQSDTCQIGQIGHVMTFL